jgi:hypothetical protein
MDNSNRYETKGGHLKRMTPKQIAYRAYYDDPQSPTYGNATQSALKAGYSKHYANSLTSEGQRNQWMDVGDNFRKQLLEKAERNLMKLVDMPEDTRENPQMAKIWQDTNKFVSERLGKEVYSARQELTDKGGRRLFNEKDKSTATIPLASLFKVQ